MSITNRTIISDETVTDRIIFVDYEIHTGEILRKRLTILPADDAMTKAIEYDPVVLEEMQQREISYGVSLVESESSPDIVVEHQLQADYDRRVLGRMMMEVNIHYFLAAYPFFQAVELRGGANAIQRAAYLGIASTEYGEIDDRFSNASGVAWFVADEKNMIWQELPTVFE